MSVSRHVEANAENGKMTLGDLRQFVAELDQAGAADTTVIRARVTFGGVLKSVAADAVRFGDPEPAK